MRMQKFIRLKRLCMQIFTRREPVFSYISVKQTARRKSAGSEAPFR
jgi:hypothetical protein